MNITREVVQDRINTALATNGASARSAWSAMVAQGNAMVDFLPEVGTNGHLKLELGTDHHASPHVFVKISAHPQEDTSESYLSLHRNATMQLSEKIGLPTGFTADLVHAPEEWKRRLSVDLLQEHIDHMEPQRMLVRAVGHEIRGVLSNKYKRLDSSRVFKGFIEHAYAKQAVLMEGKLTDTRCHLDLITPEVVEIAMPHQEPIWIVMGARISTSDFGQGSLELKGYYLQCWCKNKAVRQPLLRQVHLGATVSYEDILSPDTIQKETQLVIAKINDLTTNAFSTGYRDQTVRMIQKAAGMELDMKKELKVLPAMGMTKAEIDALDALLINGTKENGTEGPATAWKFSNGITALARDTTDIDRQRELTDLSSNWLNRTLGPIEGEMRTIEVQS